MDSTSIESVRKLISELVHVDYILPEDIPSIDLYMDQVTTFMDNQLENNKRSPEDKTLTKTMINNYTKNELLPAPNKKKYSKDHIILLIFIYYLKNFVSISDIQSLITPMIEKYFGDDNESDISLSDIYNDIFELEKAHRDDMTKSIYRSKRLAESKYSENDDKYLHDLAFISIMSYDIYLKKQMIEKMIDNMKPAEPEKDTDATSKEVSKTKDTKVRDTNKAKETKVKTSERKAKNPQ